MKKSILFAALLLCANMVFADVLLVEDFDYAVGSLLTDCGWYEQWNGTGPLSITTGLGFDGYKGCGIGGAALLDTKTSIPIHKNLSREVAEGDVYVSFLLQPKWAENNAYFLALRDKITDNTFHMNGRVYIDEENRIGLSFSKGKISCEQAEEPLEEDKIYLVVMKYHIVAGENNDEVSLYVLSEYSATEPSKPLIGPMKDSSQPDINPAMVQLHCDHGKSPWFTIDAIRVATTWAEAVAEGTCPEDAYLNPDEEWNPTTGLETTEVGSSFMLYSALGTYMGTYTLLPQLPHGVYYIRNGKNTKKIAL